MGPIDDLVDIVGNHLSRVLEECLSGLAGFVEEFNPIGGAMLEGSNFLDCEFTTKVISTANLVFTLVAFFLSLLLRPSNIAAPIWHLSKYQYIHHQITALPDWASYMDTGDPRLKSKLTKYSFRHPLPLA
jgi:hypothetical protein